jgi:acetylornithine deacetylase/succinyl-diaminopimelate desuccinylase-like protein
VVDHVPSADERRAHPKVAMVIRSQAEVPFRTSMDLPVSQEVIRAVESARGPAIKIPNSGGTGPDVAGSVLGIPGIGIPIGNHDNNQHSYNENLRIQNLWDGIELMAALLTM